AVLHEDVPGEGRAAGEGGGAGPDEPGDRDLGQGVRAGPAGLPGAGGAGGEVGAEAAVDGRGRGRGVGALGFVGDVVVRGPAAVRGERGGERGAAGAGHRRDPGGARARGDRRTAGHQRGDGPGGRAV